jgi:hypothetical protein
MATTAFCSCTADSCGDNRFCNNDFSCESCTADEACGTSCEPCPYETPICVGETPDVAVCECDETSELETCGNGSHCVAGACEACDLDTACGPSCQDCTATTDTPFCDMSENGGQGACVQCLDNSDCRDGSTEPFNSPLGVCTPDKTCTCWVPQNDQTASCTNNSCPEGFVCAQDLLGDTHDACLKTCDIAQEPIAGMACEIRNTATTPALVWVPVTTCYAFDKFGEGCSGGGAICSVDGLRPGGVNDGTCVAEFCTYSCADGDDNWCPNASTCGGQYCSTLDVIDTDTDTATDTGTDTNP